MADNAKAKPSNTQEISLNASLMLPPLIALLINFTPIKMSTGTARAIVNLSNVCVILTNKGALLVNQLLRLRDVLPRKISLPTAFLFVPILIT